MKRFITLIAVVLLCLNAFAEETEREVVIFDGKASVPGAWTLITSVYTTNASGDFDPYLITDGGYFVVEYTGTENGIYFALSEWTNGIWAQANSPAECVPVGDGFRAVFTYAQCVQAYGSNDFSDVDAVNVGSANSEGTTTVTKLSWIGEPLKDELGADEMIFRGSATSYVAHSNMAYAFTKHVGGEFDASQITPGACFYAEYSGVKNGVYLALSSHSGATQWAPVNASETVDCGIGVYGSYFTYDAMVKAWGTDFARLDQVSVFSASAQEVTLRKLAYFAGEGTPEQMSDGHWDRPDNGIAFIGDSICQNALLAFGDWNTILARSDCSNFGIGGQTTAHLAARIEEIVNRDYDMVVFICGINDIGHGYTNAEIVSNYDAMIISVRAKNPECKFLLVSVLPTTRAFYLGQQGKIVQLNDAYQKYAAENDDVTYVDVYSSFTASAGAYAYPELLSDGLHPNAEGYAKMAEVIKLYLP